MWSLDVVDHANLDEGDVGDAERNGGASAVASEERVGDVDCKPFEEGCRLLGFHI